MPRTVYLATELCRLLRVVLEEGGRTLNLLRWCESIHNPTSKEVRALCKKRSEVSPNNTIRWDGSVTRIDYMA